MNKQNDNWICVICSKFSTGYGNNSSPIMTAGQCCNNCNNWFVTPARLNNLINGRDKYSSNYALGEMLNAENAAFFIKKAREV